MPRINKCTCNRIGGSPENVYGPCDKCRLSSTEHEKDCPNHPYNSEVHRKMKDQIDDLEAELGMFKMGFKMPEDPGNGTVTTEEKRVENEDIQI